MVLQTALLKLLSGIRGQSLSIRLNRAQSVTTELKEPKPVGEQDSMSAFAALNDKWEKKERGWKGREAKLVNEIAALKSKGVPKVESEVESSPEQATESHLAHPWEKKCSTCGGENPNYTGPPNVFCNAPGCKDELHGKQMPMGHVDLMQIKKDAEGKIDLPDVKPCLNCGSDHDAVIVA